MVASCSSSSKTATTASSSPGTTAASKFPPIPDGPIKIGLSISLSGQNAAYGLPAQKAFTTVTLKKFNEMHPQGIDGHQVQLDILDDASDVTKSVSVANQFVSSKDAFVIKLSDNPSAAAQQAAVLNKAKIPTFTYSLTTDFADATKWPYLFGILSSVPQSGQTAADWISKHSEIKKIAVLTDNLQSDVEYTNAILNPLKSSAPSVQVVKTAAISPGAVDASTAIAQLKSANPDLLLVMLAFGYGPIWQGIQAANWSPTIMTSAGAWYDGFDAMKTLATKAVAAYDDCVVDGHPPFPKQVTDLMDAYAPVFGTTSLNYLTFVNTDSAYLELIKVAVEKVHSADPDAIKQTLEGMTNQTLLGLLQYSMSPTNHSGLTGDYGPHVCRMSPFVDGPYRQPTIAP
jgi:ABC-type branched-subunit amino acid transport system substrate-binding protein